MNQISNKHVDYFLSLKSFKIALISTKNHLGTSCHSDHDPLAVKFKLKLMNTHRSSEKLSLDLALQNTTILFDKKCVVEDKF